MKKILCFALFIAVYELVLPAAGYTQTTGNVATLPGSGLFESDKILEMTLSGNTKALLDDRTDDSKFYPVTLSYMQQNGVEIVINAKAKTRGHFRKLRGNCFYPPILLHFTKGDSLNLTSFKEQLNLKLVMPCKGDEYVVYEWLVYKIYNLVTPKSFNARLVRVKLNNSKNNKTESPFYGILLEEEKQMAGRNGLVSVTKKLQPEQTDPSAFLKMTVFQYLVGNVDWSVQYLQNIKLIAPDSNAVSVTAVPYDFDHSGLVNAPYAALAEELEMSSVRQRRYRGYCITDMKTFDSSIVLFNSIKDDIYELYNSCTLISEKYKKATIKYLDDFYTTLNTPEKLQKEFGYPCDKNGTGNIIIGGLKMQREE
jgi:hypothetical protein